VHLVSPSARINQYQFAFFLLPFYPYANATVVPPDNQINTIEKVSSWEFNETTTSFIVNLKDIAVVWLAVGGGGVCVGGGGVF
jgi:hypothetical protein